MANCLIEIALLVLITGEHLCTGGNRGEEGEGSLEKGSSHFSFLAWLPLTVIVNGVAQDSRLALMIRSWLDLMNCCDLNRSIVSHPTEKEYKNIHKNKYV